MLAGYSQGVLLTFEGPDRYSSVGGLATRVSSLARALGEAEIATDVYFVGDPNLPNVETFAPNVTLHRWCQWISAYHPRNVYDGEEGKVNDFTDSVPPVVMELIARAHAESNRVLVIAEEWQTSEALIALDLLLRGEGIRAAATLIWNANNTYGFARVDWDGLQLAAAVTTISRYMKFELARWNVPSLVIPNGIDEVLLDGPPRHLIERFRSVLRGQPALVKVGRFDPDKNWLQAIDAVAELKETGLSPQLIVRGGHDPYGDFVMAHARARGLSIARIEVEGDDLDELARAMSECDADVMQLVAFLPESTLHALYVAADAVLANSGKEPFGLVGLEVMASGGIAVCGSTGEDYAEPFANALVCDTTDGRELAEGLRALMNDPRRSDDIRQAGYATASRYTWGNVLQTLGLKLEYVARLGR